MQETFAYFDGSRWLGGFASRQDVINDGRSRGFSVHPDTVLSVWMDSDVPQRRRGPAAAPAGSMASFLALGQ